MGGKQKLDLDDTKKLLVNGDMMLRESVERKQTEK